MFLVCGLGNPGARYDRTRHNVGFEVVDALAARYNFPNPKSEKKSVVYRGVMGDTDVLLQKPQTFMNLSGEALGALARYYRVSPERVIVVHDELDFEPGVVRLKRGGGAGGHNGLRSIIQHLSGADFIRVRVGVGKPGPGQPGADWVLSKFAPAERTAIDEAVIVACEAAVQVIDVGVVAAMNDVNRGS